MTLDWWFLVDANSLRLDEGSVPWLTALGACECPGNIIPIVLETSRIVIDSEAIQATVVRFSLHKINWGTGPNFDSPHQLDCRPSLAPTLS